MYVCEALVRGMGKKGSLEKEMKMEIVVYSTV